MKGIIVDIKGKYAVAMTKDGSFVKIKAHSSFVVGCEADFNTAPQINTGLMLMLNSTITPVNTTVDTLRVQLLCLTVIMLLLSIFLALFMSKKISKPIIKINNSAKQLALGNYDISFEGKGYLEVSELNETLNYAAKELSKTEKLRQELIANISHDLRTPLTLITGYAEVMRDLPGENSPENVQVIIDEAKRLSSLVNDVLDISKLQSGAQALTITAFNLSRQTIPCLCMSS